MMSQDECLASPHHFTHDGICYVGTDASVTMYATGTIQDPHFTVTTKAPHSVPEPVGRRGFSRSRSSWVSTSRIRPRWGAYAVLAIMSCAAGCATTPSASDQVRVTTTLADADGCNLLGKVFVADGPDAENQARAKTASLGGNVLLKKSPEVWNGNAYHCPAAAH